MKRITEEEFKDYMDYKKFMSEEEMSMIELDEVVAAKGSEDFSGEELLRLHESTDGKVSRAAISGKLINEVVHDVEDEMVALSLVSDTLVIDMKGVSYISNAMIRTILELQHLMDSRDGELILKDLSDEVYGAFEDMGMEDVFMIEQN